MLISVHIPKTAGTSFRQALSDIYGDRLLLDYGDKPMSWWWRHRIRRLRRKLKAWQRRHLIIENYDIIHGHFVASKYAYLPDKRYITFFRHPVYLALSNYTSLQRWRNPDSPTYRRIYIERISFREYLDLPNQRSNYRIFLAGRPPQAFDFIGLTEAFAESIRLFRKIFDIDLQIYELNRNEGEKYDELIERCGGFKKLEGMLTENMRYYDLARRRFDDLRKRFV